MYTVIGCFYVLTARMSLVLVLESSHEGLYLKPWDGALRAKSFHDTQ